MGPPRPAGAACYVIPAVRKVEAYDQRFGQLAFWLVFIGMLGIAFAFDIGGTVQVFIYRTLGLDWFGGDVFPAMGPYKAMLPAFGLLFLAGTFLIVFDLITLGHRVRAHRPEPNAAAPYSQPTSGWGRPLTGFEAGIWLAAMRIFGFIITGGLLSFNLPRVQLGDRPSPTSPPAAATPDCSSPRCCSCGASLRPSGRARGRRRRPCSAASSRSAQATERRGGLRGARCL